MTKYNLIIYILFLVQLPILPAGINSSLLFLSTLSLQV